MERLLGTLEHSFWLYDQVLPIHFALSARISGSFSLDQLRKSLSQVQMQHPLLRVGIAVAETGHPKFVEQTAPIPLRWVLRENDHDWQREVEIELTRSFDWRTAPLVRVVLLQSEHLSELIVTCYHAIADGLSIACLIRDIVKGLESESSALQPLSKAHPIEQLIPIHEQQTLPQEPRLREYSTTVSSRPRSHIRMALLSTQLTQQVCDRARQENTTVHGAISAAFLLAMARQRGSSLICQSPINARFALQNSEGSQLTPAISQAVGLYISFGLTQHDLKEDSSLWETARSLKSQLSKSRLPTQLFEVIRQQQRLTASLPEAQTVFQAMHQAHGYDLIVTNLGRLPFEQQFGSLRIEALYGPAVLTGMENERIVGVATLGSQLSVTVTNPATVTSEQASASLAEALEVLSEAVLLPSNPVLSL
ncbi:condensation domain-containing protein [Phormidesmis sp. 146-35]